jgi:hypothetical protein
MKDYYDTNKESGNVLSKSRSQARTQQHKIMDFFRAHPYDLFAPHEINDKVFLWDIPLTSVRRAMTNLADDGKLKKTNYMKRGIYNKKVHTWRLANEI